ncbi:hypothetical protein LINGRAHAP2_LOCUS36234 [Linum grandiflorum]
MMHIEAAGKKEVPQILRNKNLYLGFALNTVIAGIRIEPSAYDIGLLREEKPEIITKPVVICKWNIRKDFDLPFGMGILVKDSKVYMIGGKYPDDKTCFKLGSEACFSKSYLSELVYEFAIPEPSSAPIVIPCCSLVALPPVAMPAPIIVKHLGEIYVLYGHDFRYDQPWTSETTSKLEKCFLVLVKDCMEWKSLPHPPVSHREFFRCQMEFLGAMGSKLYVRVANKVCCYDVHKGEWEEMHRILKHGLLTLSSLYVPATEERPPSYVVISPYDGDVDHHTISAKLIKGDGKTSAFQLIHKADDRLGTFKLIELDESESESEEEKDPCYNRSGTFALVFRPSSSVFGLTVIKVTLIPKDFEHHVEKRPRLNPEEKEEFLKVEVLLNQRYMAKGQFDPTTGLMGDAFIY